jgi:hypothetical protein
VNCFFRARSIVVQRHALVRGALTTTAGLRPINHVALRSFARAPRRQDRCDCSHGVYFGRRGGRALGEGCPCDLQHGQTPRRLEVNVTAHSACCSPCMRTCVVCGCHAHSVLAGCVCNVAYQPRMPAARRLPPRATAINSWPAVWSVSDSLLWNLYHVRFDVDTSVPHHHARYLSLSEQFEAIHACSSPSLSTPHSLHLLRESTSRRQTEPHLKCPVHRRGM